MTKLVRETSSALRGIVLGAYIVAMVFCGAGIWLVYLGAAGSSQFTFFGQSFKSTNVGIAALFLGAATVVLLIMRALRTLDSAILSESPIPENDSAPSEHWPKKRTRHTLEQRLKVLSATQWMILSAITKAEGLPAYRLCKQLRLGPSEFFHRLSTLEAEALITEDAGKLYLAAKVKNLLGKDTLQNLRG